MLVRNLSSSEFALSDVSCFTFSLYSIMSIVSISENSSRRWYHLAQNSSSLFPIDGSRSITSPFGMRFMFEQSFKKDICDSYRSSLLRRRSSRIVLTFTSSQCVSLLITVTLLSVLKAELTGFSSPLNMIVGMEGVSSSTRGRFPCGGITSEVLVLLSERLVLSKLNSD